MGIDKDLVNYLAKLLNIQIQPDEEFDIIENINNLIKEFSILSEIKNEVYLSESKENINLREDLPINTSDNQEIMSNFKYLKNNLVINPKILSGD